MDNSTNSVWTDLENARAYQQQLGITSQIPINIDFYEGRQWGNTKNLEYTKNYPRPVINIVKMICRNKKALVLSNVIRLVFQSLDSQSSKEFTEFANYIYKEAKIDKLNDKAISDGVKKGTYIYHLFWDSDAVGLNGEYEGGVRGEILDPLNVFFANPAQEDVQKQKWIMITTREDVDTVRAIAKENNLDTYVCEDEEEFNNYDNSNEQEGSNLCTVITKYFKKDREVYVEKWVKGGIIQKATSLTPLAPTKGDEEIDGEVLGLSTHVEPKQFKKEIKFSLYPIVVGNWEERENSIYGIGEVEDLIPNQKSINMSEAIKILVGQSQSSSKIVAKKGALGQEGQKISSDPLQIITDHLGKEYGNGFYTLPPGQVSPILSRITDDLIQNTRVVSGSTEVLSGEVISSQMSGQAIMALQTQASKPIAEIQERFFNAQKEIGEIFVQFFKLYYDSRFGKTYQTYDSESEQVIQAQFAGDKYSETDFSVVCEVSKGTAFSESVSLSILGQLLEMGAIDVKTYIKHLPDGSFSAKEEIIKELELKEQSELTQLRQAVAKYQQQEKAYQQQMQQIVNAYTQLQKKLDNVDNIVNENRQLKELLAKLQNEYSQKISQANTSIQSQNELLVRSGLMDMLAQQQKIGGVENEQQLSQMR